MPGGTISSMRSMTSLESRNSSAGSWDSRCSMVRGPMIGDVMAGCSRTNPNAKSIRLNPDSSASVLRAVTACDFLLVARQVHVVVVRHHRGTPARIRLALSKGAREPAPGQGAPRQHAHLVLLAHRQHVLLDATDQNRVGRLFCDESFTGSTLCDPLRFDDLMGGKGRAAEVADLPHPHQIGQRAQGLVDVGIGRWPVDLIEVDVVGAQAAQAVLASRHDPSARVALRVGVLAHDAVHLGGQNDLLPILLGQRLPHDLLGLAE